MAQVTKVPLTITDDASIGTLAWTSPTNALISDNIYATATATGTVYTHYLKATNFGFNIPLNSTINGILVEIEQKANNANVAAWVYPNALRIVKNNIIGNTDRSGSKVKFSTTETFVSYGNSTDLWGETWTPNDINDVNFGVAFSTILYDSAICLEKDTPILTVEGLVNIQNLNIGDKVYSFNEITRQIVEDEVIDIISRPISIANNKFYNIQLSNGSLIKATYNHEFYANGNWVRAENLKINDILVNSSLEEVIITNIEIEENFTEYVWDITVKNNHNFFANNILVHNVIMYVDSFRITVFYTLNVDININAVNSISNASAANPIISIIGNIVSISSISNSSFIIPTLNIEKTINAVNAISNSNSLSPIINYDYDITTVKATSNSNANIVGLSLGSGINAIFSILNNNAKYPTISTTKNISISSVKATSNSNSKNPLLCYEFTIFQIKGVVNTNAIAPFIISEFALNIDTFTAEKIVITDIMNKNTITDIMSKNTTILVQENYTEVIILALQGDTIKFHIEFRDYKGVLYDPDTINIKIYQNYNQLLTTISLNVINTKVSTGIYEYEYTIPTGNGSLVYEIEGIKSNTSSVYREKLPREWVI